MRRRTLVSLAMVIGFAAACVIGLGFIALNMGLRGPWSNEFALNAEFASANGLVPQAEVRVSGVHVGTVLTITDAPDGATLVRMALQPGIPLRRDTRAVIRPKTLLGEKFVELVRGKGSQEAYLGNGTTIPKAQTGQAIEIDDILNAMDAPTRKAMSESFRQLGIAFDSRQQDVGAALPALDTTVANLRPLARVGESRQQELDRILTNLNTIMQALADEQDQLGHLVNSGDTVMSAIASRDQALAGTVRNGAAVFGSLDQAFSGVTAADRASLQKSPATIAAGRRTLALTNPRVDQLLPELLLGQIGYPNDQLNISNAESLTLAAEWISAFSHQEATGYHALRITGLTPSAQKTSPSGLGAGASPGGTPVAPQDLSELLLLMLGSAR
jgi:phospholipid/cholesterol/gamma-HCH transport system substrate-binding protein